MRSIRSLCSWSGGKDSCFALIQAIAAGHEPAVLLNVLNEAGRISRSHGIPDHLLQAQAESAGIPIHMVSSSWEEYERNFTAALIELKSTYHLTHAVFGDIDLQAHRDWEEKVCAHAGLTADLPLWLQNRRALAETMLRSGIETFIVSCNNTMGEGFLGKKLTIALLDELEALGIDPCGENGEFHTFVYDCPLFRHSVPVNITGTHLHSDYWFASLA
ncbi:MAG TPA: diphthine--ammonia ligase [Sediminibacterium sp.]|nr:diphthine--ammonia ligase [Sediminibacterium sp.]